MNYHLKSKEKKPIIIGIYKGIALFIFLLIISFLFGGLLQNLFYNLEKQFLKTREFGSNFPPISYFKFKQSLINENESLKKQLETLALKNIDLSNTEIKYKEITNAFINDTNNISRIILKPPFSPYNSIKTEGGLNDGISVGDSVFVDDSVILGKVSFVSDSFSITSLFSSGGKEVSGYLVRDNNPIKIIGSGSGNFIANVPKDFNIKEGDVFVESDHFKTVAVVISIDDVSKGSFKKVYLKTPVSLNDIQFVNIIKDKK